MFSMLCNLSYQAEWEKLTLHQCCKNMSSKKHCWQACSLFLLVYVMIKRLFRYSSNPS